jgi:hypothetical protein
MKPDNEICQQQQQKSIITRDKHHLQIAYMQMLQLQIFWHFGHSQAFLFNAWSAISEYLLNKGEQ